ncbi:hypothetical protein [Atopomonas sediminilitoris]|uniref:hypothetical protein n=1 Tax=Atopomonas sediminilitoris TaxID=2919919 RepID=UPI001F4E98AF|nr:hypothetical protein [Atopomonas sediminilitoris]MCJ8170458.1 hypothetical protein [Atopomonas sediminilitoris]
METLITIDGASHTFETKHGKTELKVQSESTPSEDKKAPKVIVPNAWLVTRKNGFPLFAVRPKQDEKPFRIITADKLYAEKVQWFEPLADSYRELIWLHPDSSKPNSEAYSAYKHFTWKQIIDFSIVDRWSISFYSGQSGDWKQSEQGGDGYLMITVGGLPYWTDAIGQIPFAVDTFKMRCEELGDEDRAILATVKTGMEWGDGTLLGEKDYNNSYDNFMVLRGALWASDNHQLIKIAKVVNHRGVVLKKTITTAQYVQSSMIKLEAPISAESYSKYGIWKK